MNRKMNTLATLLLLVGLLFMLPVTAMAEEAVDATITPASGTCGSNLTWTLDDKGVLTISGTGGMEDYTWRYDSTLEKYVTTAPWGVAMKEVVLEKGVTSIGYCAFYECSNLSNISIPEGVTSIGEEAFAFCSSLSSISIPDGVTSIGDGAFKDCSSLNSISIPDGVTSIGYKSFSYCSNLTNITLPNGVSIIDDYAFRGCSSLCSANIPDSLTSIGSYAFDGCTSLTSISIPDSVTSIGSYAFDGCTSLTSIIIIPEGITSIGERTFYYCSSLTSITLPDSLTTIGDQAFRGCSLLSSITIPDSVTTIDKWAFMDCCALSSIYLSNSLTNIGDKAFYGCPAPLYANRNGSVAIALTKANHSFVDPSYPELSLKAYENEDGTRTLTVTDCATDAVSVTVPDGVTSIVSFAFEDCSRLGSVNLPDSVTSIDGYAFYGCSSLTNITIPDGVTSIGSSAFSRCPATRYASRNNSAALALTKANYSFVDPSYPALSLEAYETEDGTRIFSVTDCAEDVVSVTFPDGVTSIGSNAFYGCSSLSSISIPDGVTTIGNNAFYACSRLSSIYLPNSVTSIGEYGFTPLYGQTTTVYCYEFSYAEEWALQNGFTVCLLDGKETEEYLQVTLPETFTLGLGETAALPLQVFPVLPEISIVWTSADESVVQINEDGTITGAACGQAIVSVSVDGVTASCTVTVVAPVTLLALPDTIYVVAKQTRTLPLTIEPAGATVELVYETGNTIYASITEDSLLKGGAVGTTTLTVTDQLTGLTATATVRITYPVTAVSFTPEACAMDPGETLQLTANVTMRTDSCVNELVTFASSDETIAVVDEKGLLTAKASGTVTITATAASGVSGSCTVLVLPAQRSVLPACLVTIEDEALMGTPISFCVLPGSVSSIGVRAFASCTALKIIEIPAGVTIIAESAFDGCTDLIIVAPQGSAAHTFALNHGFVWMAK